MDATATARRFYRRRRFRAAFLALAGAGAVLAAYDCFVVTLWTGSHPLNVTLANESANEVAAVEATTFPGPFPFETLPPGHGRIGEAFDFQPVRWEDGSTFTTRGTCMGQTSGFGRPLSYSRHGYLLLRVEFADGTCRYMNAALPADRLQRSMTVVVPKAGE